MPTSTFIPSSALSEGKHGVTESVFRYVLQYSEKLPILIGKNDECPEKAITAWIPDVSVRKYETRWTLAL